MGGAPWGGSEELWSQAALRLHQQGHEVSASIIWWPQLSPKVLRLAEQGIDIFTQPPSPNGLPARVWRTIKNNLGVVRPDTAWLHRKKPELVVISQGYILDGLDWMNRCREFNLPYAPIINCNSEIWWPESKAGDDLARAYRGARHIFCVSRHNLELLEFQIGEPLPNAEVIWNPFNVPDGQPPAWPDKNGTWKLACVARLDPAAKGHDLLLRVLSQPKWREQPLELNIFGGGPGEQSLKKMAARLQLKNVHFRGHVADIKKIWVENHLLILPSRYEGLPLALVEAMCCARPALVTDVGGNAEMCVDGETGFVAAAPAAGLIAQTLERAWHHRHEWEIMGKAARSRAELLIPKDPVGDFCGRLTGFTTKHHA